MEKQEELQTGAKRARNGFEYQDIVATMILLEAWQDPTSGWGPVEKIECETHDDIVVVKPNGDKLFVQTKGGHHNDTWSPGALCEQPHGEGSSIIEKAPTPPNKKQAQYMIIAEQWVKKDLDKLLKKVEERTEEELNQIVQAIERAKGKKPWSGDIETWVRKTKWQVISKNEAYTRALISALGLLETMQSHTNLTRGEDLVEKLIRIVTKSSSVGGSLNINEVKRLIAEWEGNKKKLANISRKRNEALRYGLHTIFDDPTETVYPEDWYRRAQNSGIEDPILDDTEGGAVRKEDLEDIGWVIESYNLCTLTDEGQRVWLQEHKRQTDFINSKR